MTWIRAYKRDDLDERPMSELMTELHKMKDTIAAITGTLKTFNILPLYILQYFIRSATNVLLLLSVAPVSFLQENPSTTSYNASEAKRGLSHASVCESEVQTPTPRICCGLDIMYAFLV